MANLIQKWRGGNSIKNLYKLTVNLAAECTNPWEKVKEGCLVGFDLKR